MRIFDFAPTEAAVSTQTGAAHAAQAYSPREGEAGRAEVTARAGVEQRSALRFHTKMRERRHERRVSRSLRIRARAAE